MLTNRYISHILNSHESVFITSLKAIVT